MTESPQILRTIDALRAVTGDWRAQGLRVGLAPTMGSLHVGHLSLVRLVQSRADRVIASIFVNPTQFGPNEDFSAYPRQEAEDAAMLAGVGCDAIWAPGVEQMYPDGFSTTIAVRGLTEMLCGPVRPGHFDGVATVVCKLLNQVGPDIAAFGEKDWQQLAVIRRLVRDLDMPVEILGAPTIREEDGLAMSSRNRYLDPEQRRIAGGLNRLLKASAEMIGRGAPVARVLEAGKKALLDKGFSKVDYLDLREADTLLALDARPTRPARLFVAAHLGRARLIDNWPV